MGSDEARAPEMPLVKSSDIQFELPVFTVTTKSERWLCRNLDDLTLVAPIQLKQGRFLGMKISDASGRRWVVRSIETIGRADPWRIFNVLFFSPPDWRVDFMLEELPPTPARKRISRANSGKRSSQPTETVSDEGDVKSLAPPAGKSTRATALIKASEAGLEYPLVGFTRKAGALAFGDPQTLTTCAIVYVRNETLIGMELIDSRLKRWVVRSLLPEYPIPIRKWWHLSVPDMTFDLELEEIGPIDLKALKRRLLDDWELEDFEDEKAVLGTSELAAMLEAGHRQATGLLD